jgi:hypothetical protein
MSGKPVPVTRYTRFKHRIESAFQTGTAEYFSISDMQDLPVCRIFKNPEQFAVLQERNVSG